MSSLVSLKTDIEQIQEDLFKEVTAQVELEDNLAGQTKKVQILQDHLKKLNRALSILEGNEPEPVLAAGEAQPPSVAAPTVEAPTKPKKQEWTGHRCTACDGKMKPHATIMPSGMRVQHLQCEDCSNQVY